MSLPYPRCWLIVILVFSIIFGANCVVQMQNDNANFSDNKSADTDIFWHNENFIPESYHIAQMRIDNDMTQMRIDNDDMTQMRKSHEMISNTHYRNRAPTNFFDFENNSDYDDITENDIYQSDIAKNDTVEKSTVTRKTVVSKYGNSIKTKRRKDDGIDDGFGETITVVGISDGRASIAKYGAKTRSMPCCSENIGANTCVALRNKHPYQFRSRCRNDADFAMLQCCYTCRTNVVELGRELFALGSRSRHCFDRHNHKFCMQFVHEGGMWSANQKRQVGCNGDSAPLAFRICRRACGFCDVALYDEANASSSSSCLETTRTTSTTAPTPTASALIATTASALATTTTSAASRTGRKKAAQTRPTTTPTTTTTTKITTIPTSKTTTDVTVTTAETFISMSTPEIQIFIEITAPPPPVTDAVTLPTWPPLWTNPTPPPLPPLPDPPPPPPPRSSPPPVAPYAPRSSAMGEWLARYKIAPVVESYPWPSRPMPALPPAHVVEPLPYAPPPPPPPPPLPPGAYWWTTTPPTSPARYWWTTTPSPPYGPPPPPWWPDSPYRAPPQPPPQPLPYWPSLVERRMAAENLAKKLLPQLN